MKKLSAIVLALFTAFAAFAVPSEANDKHEENWSQLSYYSTPIYKILDSRDAYIVIYAKNSVGVGQTVIPKSWASWNKNEPRKLSFRNVPRGKLKSQITIFKKEGEFYKVVLNVPMNKANPVWGVVKPGVQIDGIDKDTLEDLEL